jgi:hypothetical protein
VTLIYSPQNAVHHDQLNTICGVAQSNFQQTAMNGGYDAHVCVVPPLPRLKYYTLLNGCIYQNNCFHLYLNHFVTAAKQTDSKSSAATMNVTDAGGGFPTTLASVTATDVVMMPASV